jgi:hypothetical protein
VPTSLITCGLQKALSVIVTWPLKKQKWSEQTTFHLTEPETGDKECAILLGLHLA